MIIDGDGEALAAENEGEDERCAEGEPLVLDEEDFTCQECSDKQIAPIPITPSQREVDDHNVDHLPYRSWCRFCVMGRAVGEAHRSKEEDESKRAVITFDYLFITRGRHDERCVDTRDEVKGKEVLLKILVVKDTKSKTVFAHVVSRKGADQEAVRRMVEDIRWLGYTAVGLKADNERAIAKLLHETLKAAKLEIAELESVTEEKPVSYDSKSNGAIEIAVRQVQGLLRTHKASLEGALSCKVPTRHPVIAWLVEHVAMLITARVRGTDGRTAWQRARGKPFGKRLLCFGEMCLYKLNIKDPKQDDGKIEPRWKLAPFMGYDRHSNEYVLAEGENLKRSRTVQRVPRAQQWDWKALQSIAVLPGERRTTPMEFPSRQGVPLPEEIKEKLRVAKQVFLRKKDFENFGKTPGCRRCEIDSERGWGNTKLPHSRECRVRIEAKLEETEDGRRRLEEAKKRADRWTAEQYEGAPAEEDAEPEPPEHDARLEPPDDHVDPREGVPGPETPREDADMAMLLEAVPYEEQKMIKMKDREIMEIVRQLGGQGQAYRRERTRALRPLLSEIYSAPRVTAAAKLLPGLGIIPGFALDLTTLAEDGKPWDFDQAERRAQARQKIIDEKPMFLIGSPMCTAFSSWQALNAQTRDPQDVRRDYTRAMVHLRFVCELYALQYESGRYFVHEHPAGAQSWNEGCIHELLQQAGVSKVVIDQCQYGQQTPEGEPMKKPTTLMSNAPELLKAMNKRCDGRGGRCSRARGGAHATVSGRLARLSAVYPFEMCRSILVGCRNQLRADGRLLAGVIGIQHPEADMSDEALQRRCERLWLLEIEEECLMAHDGTVYRDALTGQPLQPELVREARRKELEYFTAKGVWVKRSRDEAFKEQGKAPISVKWVDVNKGDDERPNYRSRLVAREIRRAGEDPFFSPTPPLESIRLILSLAATDLPGHAPHDRDPQSPTRTQISVLDIARAYFNAKVDPRDAIYVDLPDEDPDKRRGLCGKLLCHMYGTRAAGDGWHDDYSTRLVGMGFERGDASACVFRHAAKKISCSVYGDDFTSEGPKDGLDWFKGELEKHYELTESARLGPGAEDDKEGRILNRVVRWTPEGLEYEADPRQAEKLAEQMGLSGANPTATPGLKPTFDQLQAEEPLPQEKHRVFRGVAARANYLSADRPEIQFAAKEICRWMAKPTTGGVLAVKRLVRFLEGHRRLVFRYPWQAAGRVDVYSDTDWAGCPKTRKSTSGGCLMLGSHLLKSWSCTQGQISLSSGEAEFYGVVRAAGTGLGFRALLSDLGVPLPLRVWTDSTATMGICGRQGLGKLRHVDTQCLWIQQRIRDGSIELRKVRGEVNPADLFTKHLPSRDKVRHLLLLFNCHYADGRPESAPQLKRAGDGLSPVLGVERTSEEPTVEIEGRRYPGVWIDGELVPEAYCHDERFLPHEQGDDLDALFPRARAAPSPGDEDIAQDEHWLRRGWAIGCWSKWKATRIHSEIPL